MAETMTMDEWAAARAVSARTVRRWLADGRVPGAEKKAGVWMIPADAPAPFTTPAHMRPSGRTLAGEVVGNGVHSATGQRGRTGREVAVVTPEDGPGRFIPEGPPGLVTVADFVAACGGNVTARGVAAMLEAGELAGLRRGRRGRWVIPYSEIRRLRGE